METKDKIQIAALVIISVLIVVLIMTVVVFAKNVDEIKSNPVQYSIDKDFYSSCSCVEDGVGVIEFNKEEGDIKLVKLK